ncbi:MAG TPA: MupA/Atu3671 family FMN-dependent luciferase-like monooxygenase [Trebonia sp.]|nr:MupA/Atu3671 family FMN-dependent luciferase-like monooxygenase [Trebonia sp.]
MEFSLFYFGNDQPDPAGRYRLLIEGAKIADAEGFRAVWTPERHFHPFGGLYPSPSVTGAAVAALTRQVGIRAGSVVAPLQDPLRIAEEWAVVDNISGGRAGVSFASGWNAIDFGLRPDAYRRRREVMRESIATVRALWRGEEVDVTDGTGQPARVRIYPEPVQPELPIWITSAGSVETFEAAGELGTSVLTHLLGQDLNAVAAKIARYRWAWERHQGQHRPERGGQARPHVTLMLHTFLGESRDTVRDLVREPFIGYLATSFDLIARLLSKAGLDPAQVRADEVDYVVRRSFDRYFDTSGLFGTVADGAAMVRRLAAIGVDEIGCLIDFGVDPELTLAHLKHLVELKATHG